MAAKRDELIARWSDEHDGTDPDARTIAALERAAAVSSRPPKTGGVDGAVLHDTWTAQAKSVGFEPNLLTRGYLPGRSTEAHPDDRGLIAEAIRRVSEESSTWLRADLARHLATVVPAGDGAAAGAVVARIDHLSARAATRCRVLAPNRPPAMGCRRDGRPVAEHLTDRRLTTDAVLDQELTLQAWAQGHADPAPPTGGDSQAGAAEAMAGDATLVVVVGPAGTGKTTATARAVRTPPRPRSGGGWSRPLRQGRRCPRRRGRLPHRDPRRVPHPPPRIAALAVGGGHHGGPRRGRDGGHRGPRAARRPDPPPPLAAHHRGGPGPAPRRGRGGVFAHWCATVAHHELTEPRRFDQRWEAAASLALRAGDPNGAEAYANTGVSTPPTGGLTVTHLDRGTVALPADYVNRHLELGWAVTGYGNQGDTVDIGLAVLEPGTTRNGAYVALTRGRTLNRAWLPDPTGTVDPADGLATIIAHTPDHHSALATHAALHREADLPASALTGGAHEIRLPATGRPGGWLVVGRAGAP